MVLTDLRSASVNNDNFAQVAVRHNLHQHLLHSSGLLVSQILEYVKVISESDPRSLPSIRAPKFCLRCPLSFSISYYLSFIRISYLYVGIMDSVNKIWVIYHIQVEIGRASCRERV